MWPSSNRRVHPRKLPKRFAAVCMKRRQFTKRLPLSEGAKIVRVGNKDERRLCHISMHVGRRREIKPEKKPQEERNALLCSRFHPFVVVADPGKGWKKRNVASRSVLPVQWDSALVSRLLLSQLSGSVVALASR